MIKAICKLGEWSLMRNNQTPLDIMIESIDSDRNSHAIVIDVDDDRLKNIYLEEINTHSSKKYLYRKGTGGNSKNFSPSSKITEVDKTLKNKFFKWFSDIEKSKNDFSKEELDEVKKLNKILLDNEDNIYSKTKEFESELKKAPIITLKYNGKYLKEIPEIVSIFEKSINASQSKISSNNKKCSICGKEKTNVLGGSNIYKFYTIDKQGFISSDFIKEKSWRNYPICQECNLLLTEGRKFIEENNRLVFKFVDFTYQLIPNFLIGSSDMKDDFFENIEETNKKISLKQESRTNYLGSEQEILNILAEYDDFVAFNMLFVKKSNSAERILLNLDEILPSRLKKLFLAKNEVENKFHKADGGNRQYNFYKLRTFFKVSEEGKRKNDLDKYFLNITEAVFKKKKIDYQFLLNFFMKQIRTKFVNPEEGKKYSYSELTKDALMNIIFLNKVDVLHFNEVYFMQDSKFKDYLVKYGNHLNSPEKQALFLLGAMTEHLLYIQQQERNSQPFAEQLKSLKMRENDFKGLLPKIKEKLRQYNKSYYSDKILMEEISKLFLNSKPNWNMPVDEMNFYFVAGMSLQYELYDYINKQYSKTNEENNNE